MPKAKISMLFTMMISGLILMYSGFSGYYVSYQSIIEVVQGERRVTNLFQPRIHEPIKRVQFDLNDTKSYYSRLIYTESLQKIWQALLNNKSKQDIEKILRRV